MASNAGREYDAIIFGATGVTGMQTVKMFSKLGVCGNRWAIAGRSAEKLKRLQTEHSVPGIVIADTGNPESMVQMAAKGRLLLNATGPYRFFGEAVVKACIEARTDYIDLCGEPAFMEKMLLEYGEAARAAGVVVCHACAFDSVPADLGILRCAELFEKAGGECGHVELTHTMEAPHGYVGHDTTFQAAVHGIGATEELKKLRRSLDEKYGKVPKGSTVSGSLPVKRLTRDGKGRYLMQFVGSDASVVRMSRRIQANILNQDMQKLMPQFGIYMGVSHTSSLCKMIFGGGIMGCFAQYSCGRNMMINNPGCFTFGGFSSAGPTPKQMENNTWIGDFVAKGKVGDSDKTVILQARLDDPGYIGTSLLFATVAETILQDRAGLNSQAGVFTPAALFRGTSLMDRLSKHGFELKVVESDLGS